MLPAIPVRLVGRAGPDTGQGRVHQEGVEPGPARLARACREDDQPGGDGVVDHDGLAAGDDKPFSHGPGQGGDGPDVRAGPFLGEAEPGCQALPCDVGQERCPALSAGADLDHLDAVRRGRRPVKRAREPEPQGLVHHARTHVIETRAPELHGDLQGVVALPGIRMV